MSSWGRSQDAAWDVLESFGIDPTQKCDGWGDTTLSHALVKMIYPIAYEMGKRVGMKDAMPSTEEAEKVRELRDAIRDMFVTADRARRGVIPEVEADAAMERLMELMRDA